LVLLIFLDFNVLVTIDEISVLFGFTFWLIWCDGVYFVGNM